MTCSPDEDAKRSVLCKFQLFKLYILVKKNI